SRRAFERSRRVFISNRAEQSKWPEPRQLFEERQCADWVAVTSALRPGFKPAGWSKLNKTVAAKERKEHKGNRHLCDLCVLLPLIAATQFMKTLWPYLFTRR